MNFKSSFGIDATVISNVFIDEYMAGASGEYVKEYLYLLRHEGEAVTASMIADALNHTEADVARALAYWKKAGVLEEDATAGGRAEAAASRIAGAGTEDRNGTAAGKSMEEKKPEERVPEQSAAGRSVSEERVPSQSAAGRRASEEGVEEKNPSGQSGLQERAGQPDKRPVYTADKITSLAGDEDFAQLLYIAQKYINKVFTQRDCEVFAYLYDGLSMPAELLEYVVEYCVQGGHSSLRYIETVAMSWHEKGFRTVEDAKNYAVSFSKDSFAVMKAFGINDRNPGKVERDFMDRWFKAYGFTRELVTEACNRTLAATHEPSFQYADKILEGWKKAGVRSMEEIKKLDEQHADRLKNKDYNPGKKGAAAVYSSKGRNGTNQFQNFPQRETDYDALVLKQLTEQK